MADRRKCKTCGRLFAANGLKDGFCSALCKATSFFIGGGGDTNKPGVQSPHPQKNKSPMKIRNGNDRFPRVKKMFELPEGRARWEIAKDFTEEEIQYARRVEKRRLDGERRLEIEWSWEEPCDDEEEEYRENNELGESDDGSI